MNNVTRLRLLPIADDHGFYLATENAEILRWESLARGDSAASG